MRRLAAYVGALATLGLAATGCGGDAVRSASDQGEPAHDGPGMPAAAIAPVARTCVPGAAVGHVRGEESTAVVLRQATVALRRPGGASIARFGRLNVNGVPTVFRVLESRAGADCTPRWYRVQLPIRPNGATGWIRARVADRYTIHTRILIDLSDRRVTVYHRGKIAMRLVTAIGKLTTPTPTGRFYVNQRLLTSDPSGPWGPGAVGISAFSPVLRWWPQGGPVAIHGTNHPETIGQAASNGCLRIENAAVARLMKLAVPGTPVRIRA